MPEKSQKVSKLQQQKMPTSAHRHTSRELLSPLWGIFFLHLSYWVHYIYLCHNSKELFSLAPGPCQQTIIDGLNRNQSMRTKKDCFTSLTTNGSHCQLPCAEQESLDRMREFPEVAITCVDEYLSWLGIVFLSCLQSAPPGTLESIKTVRHS